MRIFQALFTSQMGKPLELHLRDIAQNDGLRWQNMFASNKFQVEN